jgi:hypothetical protein
LILNIGENMKTEKTQIEIEEKNIIQREQNQVARDIEKSIQKKFHKTIFNKFCKAINEYDLVSENDKIAVCISGGKDSMLLANFHLKLFIWLWIPDTTRQIENLLKAMQS